MVLGICSQHSGFEESLWPLKSSNGEGGGGGDGGGEGKEERGNEIFEESSGVWREDNPGKLDKFEIVEVAEYF